jgi:hypothetical protein
MHGQTLLPSQGHYLPHVYYLGELKPSIKKSTHVRVDLHHALHDSANSMARPLHIGAKGCKALVVDARCPNQSVVIVMQPNSTHTTAIHSNAELIPTSANDTEQARATSGGGSWRFATEEEMPPALTLLRTRTLWHDKEHFQSSLSVKEHGLRRFLPGTLVQATIKEVCWNSVIYLDYLLFFFFFYLIYLFIYSIHLICLFIYCIYCIYCIHLILFVYSYLTTRSRRLAVSCHSPQHPLCMALLPCTSVGAWRHVMRPSRVMFWTWTR